MNSLPARFWRKIRHCQTTDCWIWTGPDNGIGYGRINVDGSMIYTHRLAFQVLHGPIGLGLVLDHLCKTPACCNPSHLEAVTQRTNVMRGTSPAALAATAESCPHGHAYSFANTYVTPRGHRKCRACHRAEARDRHEAKRR